MLTCWCLSLLRAIPAKRVFGFTRLSPGLGYPFDIIVMAVERFEESKDVIGGIAYPANKYGKVIYEEAA